jgi:hypothetical protein
VLAEDIPLDSDGPRLPMLTKLILLDARLTAIRTFNLRDMLIERVEQGVPLEYLDLRTCVAANRAIQLLAEIVVDVQEPLDAPPNAMEPLGWHGGIGFYNEVGFADEQVSWYSDTDDGEDDDRDEDDDDDEDDDEMDYDDGSDFGDEESHLDDEPLTWY